MFITEEPLKVRETILYNTLKKEEAFDELITRWLEWIVVSGLHW